MWVVGSSIIRHAFCYARSHDANLGIPNSAFWWQGYGGLSLKALVRKVTFLKHINEDGLPHVMIIHIGGNDIGQYPTKVLMAIFAKVIRALKDLFPSTTLAVSQITPRTTWRYSSNKRAMGNVRRRLNGFVKKPY